MAYEIEFSDEFEKAMKKLKRKSEVLFDSIQKKLIELVENPEHVKNHPSIDGWHDVQHHACSQENLIRFSALRKT